MAITVAMIALGQDAAPSVADICRDLAQRWPQLPPVTDVHQTDDTIAFRVGQADVAMGRNPQPIPWSDLEGPCGSSTLWTGAAEILKRHPAHWIVTVSGELTPLPLCTLLTQATASALAACPSALGVYWGNAALVVPKDLFIDFAVKVLPHAPPLHIWVDFRVRPRDPNTSAGFTVGLAALGHKEFEAPEAPESAGDLHDRLLALSRHVLEHGAISNDGQPTDEQVRLLPSPSAFGRPGEVLRLVYEL